LVYFHQGRFDVALEYNEGLAHQLYAGADFLLMPSLVEPCGLNQMYAMRYGNVPVVRSVGGLRDTVPDVGEPDGGGRGIRFDRFDLDDAHHAVWRATQLFRYGALPNLRQRIMAVDFSWENAARQYIQLYNELQ
jgi:starch synthase